MGPSVDMAAQERGARASGRPGARGGAPRADAGRSAEPSTHAAWLVAEGDDRFRGHLSPKGANRVAARRRRSAPVECGATRDRGEWLALGSVGVFSFLFVLLLGLVGPMAQPASVPRDTTAVEVEEADLPMEMSGSGTRGP